MKRFLIILLPQKLHIYKSIDNKEFEVFYINGEEILEWSTETYSKDFQDLKNEILDILNLENFNEIGFKIIYDNVDLEVIKELSKVMLPCAWWQVITEEKASHDLEIINQHKENIEIKNNLISKLNKSNELLNIQVKNLKNELEKVNNERNELYNKVNKLEDELNEKVEKIDIVRNWIYSNLDKEYIERDKVEELREQLGFVDIKAIGEYIENVAIRVGKFIENITRDIGNNR